MIRASKLKTKVNSDVPDRATAYFGLSVFHDEAAREQLLGPMPSAASSKPKPPQGIPAYLASLWDCPLLTAEQEYHCFQKLNYLKFLVQRAERLARSCTGCFMMMDERNQHEEQSLKVRNRIVESNLRLVVSLAKKYASFGSNEFDELVCVGNAALLRAVDRFDFRRDVRFSTYAYQAILRAIFDEFRKEGRVKSRFTAEGNEVTVLAVADAGASDLAEFNAAEARAQAIGLIEQLDVRDRKIVMARFGINRKHNGAPFHVIAKEIGLSTTRTVQLFHRSIDKLRELIASRQSNAECFLNPCP